MPTLLVLGCLVLSDFHLISQHRPPETITQALVLRTSTCRDTGNTHRRKSSVALRLHNFCNPSPSVAFIDPATKCHVTLLGCFHGTESSSKDVVKSISSETDIVVLELCPSRLTAFRRDALTTKPGVTDSLEQKPWLLTYWEGISKTIRQCGLPTGLAAAILGGFSGIQTALSGFTPGLEFKTALDLAQKFGCDVILADQDVTETFRKVGSLPQIAVGTATSSDRINKWQLDQETLFRAVFGQQDQTCYHNGPLQQVNLPLVLVRNFAAFQDIMRLTFPPCLLVWLGMSIHAVLHRVYPSTTIIDKPHDVALPPHDTILLTLSENLIHGLVSCAILSFGYLGLALPAVRVILTERDEVLTKGIQAACRRAGKGGHVVVVMGLLHVNGVAKRMLCVPSTSLPKMDVE